MPAKRQQECSHSTISYNSSPHATLAKYKQPTQKQRHAATESANPSKLKQSISLPDLKKFPAPLVLPEDDLALDPDYPSQCFQEWHDEENRNPITPRKKTIYIVQPPRISKDISIAESWTRPRAGLSQPEISTPNTQDVMDYVAAFYHGCPVKCLQLPNWSFTSWMTEDNDAKVSSSKKRTRYIGLNTKTECIGIRTRPCPDKIYPAQLNLDDLLDVAISILPKDAYALCMLVDHDLYEDDDDTFVCGRAYGGSRVAVVSTARYNPGLDAMQSVEREHAWPASHCKSYIEELCKTSHRTSANKRQKLATTPAIAQNAVQNGPLEAALAAISSLPPINNSSSSPSLLSTLWLASMCRTVTHELGHCFGIDHCVYYACIMQGSASLSEDTRQPPYLCPVDLSKVLYATGASKKARYAALLEYCEQPKIKDLPHFAAFAAWIRTISGP